MSAGANKSILIAGTGAMACLFAAKLSSAGLQVYIMGTWTEGLEALKLHGVRLVDLLDAESSHPVRVITSPEECTGMRYALVLVKSWQTARAAQALKVCLAPEGIVLTLQNGLGNRECLTEALGLERVALGVTTIGATMLGPGRVRQAGEGGISLGEHSNLGSLPLWLKAAGFRLDFVEDTESLMWGKLVINAAINPLTGLLRVPNGELLNSEPTRVLMHRTAQEAAQVAIKMGLELPFQDPVKVVDDVAQKTALNISSMLQDIRRGARTEIDAINGAIVSAGESVGIPTPINYTLWQLIRAYEAINK